jgi:hypothetical protein
MYNLNTQYPWAIGVDWDEWQKFQALKDQQEAVTCVHHDSELVYMIDVTEQAALIPEVPDFPDVFDFL